MHSYALDVTGKRVYAASALGGIDYRCIECEGVVRVRISPRGLHHFFHLRQESDCRSSKKSEEHILLQEFIQRTIYGTELEVPFPEINRIADVIWPEKKIVFEVQCSPILAKELRERTNDYASSGWYVIWILFDKTFMRKNFSAVTACLQSRTHYYATADAEENRVNIFDFLHCEHRADFEGKRQFIVDLSTLEMNSRAYEQSLPSFLAARRYFAKGDLLWQLRNGSFTFPIEEIQERAGQGPILSFFRSAWYLILENALRSR